MATSGCSSPQSRCPPLEECGLQRLPPAARRSPAIRRARSLAPQEQMAVRERCAPGRGCGREALQLLLHRARPSVAGCCAVGEGLCLATLKLRRKLLYKSTGALRRCRLTIFRHGRSGAANPLWRFDSPGAGCPRSRFRDLGYTYLQFFTSAPRASKPVPAGAAAGLRFWWRGTYPRPPRLCALRQSPKPPATGRGACRPRQRRPRPKS